MRTLVGRSVCGTVEHRPVVAGSGRVRSGPGRSGAKRRASEARRRRSVVDDCHSAPQHDRAAHRRRRPAPIASPPARPPSAEPPRPLPRCSPCVLARPARAVGAHPWAGRALGGLRQSRGRNRRSSASRPPLGGASATGTLRFTPPCGGTSAGWPERGPGNPAAGAPTSVIAPSPARRDRCRRAGLSMRHGCALVKPFRTAAPGAALLPS